MRTLQLLTLALLVTAARADTFAITFTATSTVDDIGDPHSAVFSTGNITTDGVCTTCSIFQNFFDIEPNGITDITAGIWNLGDPDRAGDRWGSFTFVPATGQLDGFFAGGDESVTLGAGSYFFNGASMFEHGTYSVESTAGAGSTSAPEPSSAALLLAAAAYLMMWMGSPTTRSRKASRPLKNAILPIS